MHQNEATIVLISKRRTLMQIIEKLVIIAQNDFKNENRDDDGSPKQQCCHTPNHKQTLFSKFDLINLVTA